MHFYLHTSYLGPDWGLGVSELLGSFACCKNSCAASKRTLRQQILAWGDKEGCILQLQSGFSIGKGTEKAVPAPIHALGSRCEGLGCILGYPSLFAWRCLRLALHLCFSALAVKQGCGCSFACSAHQRWHPFPICTVPSTTKCPSGPEPPVPAEIRVLMTAQMHSTTGNLCATWGCQGLISGH